MYGRFHVVFSMSNVVFRRGNQSHDILKFWMVIFRWSSDGIKSVKHCVVVVTGGESL